MTHLKMKAFAGLAGLFVVMAAVLFAAAGTLAYWQAWAFLAVFFGSSFLITLDLIRHDKKLLERRITVGPLDEKQRSQKVIQMFAQAAFLLVIIFPALDHHFMWSSVSPFVSIAADALIAAGFFIVYRVFRANSYAGALIEVGAEQQVISTGPYAVVRHPMYSGALLLLLGVPLALGSWWGVFAVIPITLTIIWRLLDEERFLKKSLRGYEHYQSAVKFRLVPFVW